MLKYGVLKKIIKPFSFMPKFNLLNKLTKALAFFPGLLAIIK